MPINFFQLLQDSWNFMRNQKTFSLYATGLLIVFQAVGLLASSSLIKTQAEILAGGRKSVDLSMVLSGLAPSIITALINLLIMVLIILNIKAINAGHYQHFFQNMGKAVAKLLPIVLLYILMLFPLAFALSSVQMGAMGELSILALPLLVMGILVYVKLSLSIYTYLVEETEVFQAVKFTWEFTKGKFLAVFGYCLISSLIPQMLTSLLSRGLVSVNEILAIVLSLFVATIFSVFTTIFGFRFYQIIRKA